MNPTCCRLLYLLNLNLVKSRVIVLRSPKEYAYQLVNSVANDRIDHSTMILLVTSMYIDNASVNATTDTKTERRQCHYQPQE